MTDQEARDELMGVCEALLEAVKASSALETWGQAVLTWMTENGYRKHPEPVVEYGIRAEGDTDPWSDHSDDLDWLLDNASEHMGMSDYAVQRTKAGPWEPVTIHTDRSGNDD